MAISLKHLFQSAKQDSGDATLIQPSNWNEEHTLTLGTGKLVGRTTAGTGAAEEISVGSGLSLSGGVLDTVEAQNLFKTISVAGQSDIEADSTTDTLTVAAGSGITLTTNASTDTLTIGVTSSTYQPLDATLTSLAGLGTAADKFAYTTGVDTWAEGAITSFGRSLIDDSDASTARTTLGLGTMATETASNYLTTSSASSTYQPLDSDLTSWAGVTRGTGFDTAAGNAVDSSGGFVTSATFAAASGKKLTANNSLTLAGTDSTTFTFPSTSDTVAGLGTAQTFTAKQTVNLSGEQLALGSAGANSGVMSFAGSTSGKVTVQAAAAAGTYTLTLPTSAGSSNQVLQTDGAGVLSWGTVSASPGGSNTQLQYNSSGSFAGASGITTDGTDLSLDSSSTLKFSTDLILGRKAAANLRLGAADAASPVAQTISTQNVVAGTTNTAGTNLTIAGSQGTGTGAGGSIVFQVAPAGSSGTAQNALAAALTISSAHAFTLNSSALIKFTNTNAAHLNLEFGYAGYGIGDNANGDTLIYINNSAQLRLGANIIAKSTAAFAFSSATVDLAADTLLTRRAAANLRFGAADSAASATITVTIASPGVVTWASHGLVTGTPVTFSTTGALPTGITAGTTYYVIYVSSSTFQLATSYANALAGTAVNTSGSQSGTHTGQRGAINQTLSVQSVVAGTTNFPGADLTITGSQGTGTGAGGSIIFQVAPAGSSGTAQNALSEALRINSAGLISFAGTTSSFPALKRSSATLQVRLADDSAYAKIEALNLTNGRTIQKFTPLDNQPPASNFATLDTRNSVATLDFDDATDESAVFVGVIPEGAILTSGIKVRLFWAATTATSGDCRWGASFEKFGTDIDSDSFDTETFVATTTSGTSGIVVTTEITCTTIDSLAAGDQFRLKVLRSAANAADTMTGDAELIAVELQQVA